MHVDMYTTPRAPRLHHGPHTTRSRQPNFYYTGDQFIFTRPAEATPVRPPPTDHGFWAWLAHLFQ